MRNVKRILTVLCSVAMVATLAVPSAFAYGGGGGSGGGGGGSKQAGKESRKARRISKEVQSLTVVVQASSDGGDRSVELSQPGTVTTVAVGQRPSRPEPMSSADRARVEQARIKDLPIPEELQ